MRQQWNSNMIARKVSCMKITCMPYARCDTKLQSVFDECSTQRLWIKIEGSLKDVLSDQIYKALYPIEIK
jgi:hypothetical protein